MIKAINLVGRSDLSESPSFNGYSSGHNLADIAARIVSEFRDEDGSPYDDEDLFYSSRYPRNDALLHNPKDKPGPGLEEEHVLEADQKPNRVVAETKDDAQTEKKSRNDGVVVVEEKEEDEVEGQDGYTEREFEFSVPRVGERSSPVSADELFQNGQIRPLFPLLNTDLIFADSDWRFDRQYDSNRPSRPSRPPNRADSAVADDTPIRLPLKKLLIQERDAASCSSSEADDLEGVAPDTYCLWTPDRRRDRREELSRKSNSTGSSSKRWRLRQLLYRSNSDGSRDSVVFVPAQSKDQKQQRRHSTSVAVERKPERKDKEKKLPPAPTEAKGKGNSYAEKRATTRESGQRKKSYLLYKQDLLGLFSNATGVSRTIQPF